MKAANVGIIVFTVLSLISLGFIFHNSMQNGAVSNERSEHIAEQIESVVAPPTQNTAAAQQQHKKDSIQWNIWVRKAAHGIEYALFGLCLAGLLVSLYFRTGRWFIGSALFIALLSGVADEYVQTFYNRTSTVKDVLLDFAGAAGAIIAVCAIFKLVSFIRASRKIGGRNGNAE